MYYNILNVMTVHHVVITIILVILAVECYKTLHIDHTIYTITKTIKKIGTTSLTSHNVLVHKNSLTINQITLCLCNLPKNIMQIEIRKY